MLAQAVADKVVERAAALGVARVAAVHVLLGKDDEHTEDALRYAWSEVSVGTCAEGAEFVIERTTGDGLRLAAIDVERATPAPDQRSKAEGGCNLKPPDRLVGRET
jgi:Zn finger protein HypA/HybF involved in hydrogenase expression